MSFTGDIDLYATHADIVSELGGAARKLAKLIPVDNDTSDDPTLEVRTAAARDVFIALGRRTPPITQAQVTVTTELRNAIVYGALMRLYRGAMTGEGDLYSVLYKDYKKLFEGELSGVRLTLDDGASVFTQSIPVFRR